MATDEDEARARLDELEGEVRAEAELSRRRRAEAEAKVRAQRERAQAERDELRARQVAVVKKQGRDRGRDRGGADLGDALMLAKKAADTKAELTRPREAGEKSWLISGGASFLLGPLGWLYAGSWREAAPAALAWLLAVGLASKIIPMFLLMPVLMVVLPLSGIAGVVYAMGYNRQGKRIRLFGDDGEEGKDRRIGRLGAGRDDEDL
ncbi:MAG TPA: hypothetical protein VM734_24395 [Kofleriaceae bacterium]|nr:hypothetical protein [Kofleriaceae bacterium]